MTLNTKEPTKENTGVKNIWANIGLGLGILSIFFAYIGLIPLSGVVVNTVAIYKSKSLNGTGKRVAIVGLGLSLVFTMVYLQKYGYI